MEFQNEINGWINLFDKNPKFINELRRIQNMEQDNNFFFDDIKVFDNSFIGKYGVGYSCMNAIVVKKIIDIFVGINEFKDEDLFFVGSDGSIECQNILEELMRINDKKINYVSFSKFEGFDKKFVTSSIKKLKPTCSLYLSKSVFNNKYINMYLFDKDGMKIKNDLLSKVSKQINKSISDIKINSDTKIKFLNNDSMIKMFCDRVSSLFKKNNQKKTKVIISNRSSGITKILAKLIGSQDFPYIVNNNVSKKDINVFEKKIVNDKVIKKYFRREIIFAIRKKGSLLITYNKEGSQIFLFAINGTKVTYLNSDFITQIFLHNFYNNLSLENKTLPNSFISSNNNLSSNIKKLVIKYKINFKKIEDNNFLTKDYLLIYWNEMNQFVFGEKINDEFSIYHILIKIINIIDFYNTQYGSINALIKKLILIYDDFEYKSIYNFDKINKDYIDKKIDGFSKNNENMKFVESITNANDDVDEHVICHTIWKIVLKDENIIEIKINRLNNVISFIYTNKDKYMIFENYIINFRNKRMLNKLFENLK